VQQAYEHYLDTLPRYAGKQGAAKVERALGKQHLQNNDEAEALVSFKEIARLEDEYDVQHLTDADQRRIDDLTSTVDDTSGERHQ